MDFFSEPKKNLCASFDVAPDKSISHRAVMFSAIADGVSEISNFLNGEDCIATINCFRKLGIKIEINKSNIKVFGKGLFGLNEPDSALDVQNSGTTIRLLSGLLAAQPFSSCLTGDESIKKRPMDRVINPLRMMNAKIHGENDQNFAPIYIEESKLKGIEYIQKVASAQVKSAIILASLYAERGTKIHEPIKSRDHTELMLNYLGADIVSSNGYIYSKPIKHLSPKKITVPNDISSAAFFIVAALVAENSEIKLTNVGINPTRTGILDALIEMGGNIKITNKKIVSGEMVGDIIAKSSKLKCINIGGEIIPRMIDEIPIFALAAIYADGETIIRNAEELKVKESNRIKTVAEEFNKLGANIEEKDDGMIIKGRTPLIGGEAMTYGDHRLAMSFAIAGFLSKNGVLVKNSESASVSFPNFFEIVNAL